MAAVTPYRIALVAALLMGCSGSDNAPPADSPTPSASPSAPAVARTALTVASGPGATWATLEPKGEGYKLGGGALDGAKLKVGADRVKIKNSGGSTVAKVKAKDYGFKVYSNDETAVAKVKLKGAGFKVSDPEGAAWGTVSGEGGDLSGQPVTIETAGDTITVKRGDQVVGEVGAAVGAKAATMLAVTEIAMEQRVAAMIYVQEKMR